MNTAKDRTQRPRRVLIALLTLAMVFCLLPVNARATGMVSVPDFADLSEAEYVLASSLGDTWDFAALGDTAWAIVVEGEVTVSGRITLKNSDYSTNGYLVLRNGATLKADKGIEFDETSCCLTIFTEAGARSGKLIISNPDSGKAGIDTNGGDINFYGGSISVTGGNNAAGIEAGNGMVDSDAVIGTVGFVGPVTAQVSGTGSGVGINTVAVSCDSNATVKVKGGTTGVAISGITLDSNLGGFTTAQANAVNREVTANTSYTVAFNTDGGSAVTSQTIDAGLSATQPTAPTKSGYTFGGWTLDGSAYNFSTPVTGNITLTATWTANSAPTSAPTGGGNSNPVTPATGSAAVKAGGAQVDAASGISNAAKTAAANAISASISNARTTTVNSTDFDASQIGGAGASVSVSIKTTLNGYSLTAGDGDSAVVNKLVYDITPYASVNGGAESAVSNSAIRSGARITVYLPIPSNFPWNRADVVHKSAGRSDETYSGLAVQGSGNRRYVAVTVSHFSEFDVTPGSTGSSGGRLPNTGIADHSGAYLIAFAFSALCAATAFIVRKKFYDVETENS